MPIKQISVFLENKKGRLHRLINTIGEAGINLLAVSLSETREYGIFRAVTSDNNKAASILKEVGYAANIDDLIGIVCVDKPNAVTGVLKTLADKGINVEYTYAFSRGADAVILLKVADSEKAEKTLNEAGVKTISEF